MNIGHWVFTPEMVKSSDGFDPKYFSELAAVEDRNWWFCSRNRLITWALGSYFPQAKSFLEIGCGTGFVLSGIQRAFPDLVLSGSELFREGLAYADKRLLGVKLFQMDARRIPFEMEFDVIGAFDLLEHIEADGEVLAQMFRAVKIGGGIIVTVPHHRFLWSSRDVYSFHKRRYTGKELVEKVGRAGFKIIRITSFVSFLLMLMLISRLKYHTLKGAFDPLAEFRISHLLNWTFEKIMDMERGLIKSGISFPLGGSLLVVARRGRE
jgi:SAM-dependent methyltransferase